MKAKRQYIRNFEARSVMIIAAWTLGGAAAVQAQTPATAPRTNPPMTAPAGAMNPPPASKAEAAFNRADANHDGKLTREEAAAIPGLAARFDQIDTGHKGYITRDQYDKAMG
ncbi:MAG: EF-hand domain-containing protein [Burkholderiaceae bacterium]|nr:EF-hand domain-containing protein [Burkholderiales bacterium]TAL66608.1 MAG: EF-hand domain-containing protein [Burkholderiaceae bacterium]TBR75822.1 MAG: EF-hand domain-containing protein [Burkholderiaceae bacterium]